MPFTSLELRANSRPALATAMLALVALTTGCGALPSFQVRMDPNGGRHASPPQVVVVQPAAPPQAVNYTPQPQSACGAGTVGSSAPLQSAGYSSAPPVAAASASYQPVCSAYGCPPKATVVR